MTPDIDVILNRFAEYLASERLLPSSRKLYLKDAEGFLTSIIPPLPTDSDEFRSAAVEYLELVRAECAPATVSRKLSSLRRLSLALFDADHLRSYKPPRIAAGKPHPLPNGRADLDKMLAACFKDWHRAVIALCGMCGLRVSEARTLRQKHFKVDDAGIKWIEVTGKGGKMRRVPMTNEAWLLVIPVYVAANAQGGRLFTQSDGGMRSMITDIGKRAGLSRPVASHDLRMTFGTEVYDATKDIRVTQELLGHASPTTTQVYTGISETTKVDAVVRGMRPVA